MPDWGDAQLAYDVGLRVANGYLKRRPQMRPQRDDIVSDALLGAAKALRDHDPNLGPLDGYVAYRTGFEIIDGVRDRSPVGKWSYERGVRYDDLPEHKRPPVTIEIAATAILRARHSIREIQVADPHSEDGYAQVEAADAVQRLLVCLPPRLRMILQAIYFDDSTTYLMLAHQLGVSESRISQLHTQAIKELRRLAA